MAHKRIPHEVDDAIIEENTIGCPELTVFAKMLNSLLIEKEIHQDDLAQAVDISSGSISSYRNGKKEPRLSMIVKIANYLDVDCHYLMTGVQAQNYMCARDLGLSEKAISRILLETTPLPGSFVPEGEARMISTLNSLLTSTEFWRIVRLLGSYVNIPKQEMTRSAELVREYHLVNYGDDTNSVAATRDVIGYKMLRAFNALLDEIDSKERGGKENGKH